METIFNFFARGSGFSYNGNVFFNKGLIPFPNSDFLASTNHKLFAHLVEMYFLRNPSFQLLEKDFFFSGNRLLYLKVLSY